MHIHELLTKRKAKSTRADFVMISPRASMKCACWRYCSFFFLKTKGILFSPTYKMVTLTCCTRRKEKASMDDGISTRTNPGSTPNALDSCVVSIVELGLLCSSESPD